VDRQTVVTDGKTSFSFQAAHQIFAKAAATPDRGM